MKKIILFVIIAIFSTTTYAQINKKHHKVLNEYVVFMNKTTFNLNKVMFCLYDYYRKLELYRNNKSPYKRIYNKKGCAREIDSMLLKKIKISSLALKSIHYKEINSLADNLLLTYQQIFDKCRELEIYIRLEDYKTDNFKKSDDILDNIQNLYKKYRTQKNTLYNSIETIYNSLNKGKSNSYTKANDEMRQILNIEANFFSEYKFNFHYYSFTNSISENTLQQNINKIDNIAHNKVSYPKFEHPISFYRTHFYKDLLHTIQETKRNAIDNNTKKNSISDQEFNSFYKYYLSNFNSILVNNYNNFVESCKKKNHRFLLYNKCLPLFKIDKQKKVFKKLTSNFKNPSKIKFNLIKQSKKISYNESMALNNYINFINKDTRRIWDFGYKLTRFNKYVNKNFNNKKYKIYSFNNKNSYKLPKSLFAKAINDSRYLSTDYQKSLNQQTGALYDLIIERNNIIDKLNKHIKNKKYQNDRFKKTYELLKQFEFNLNQYNTRKNYLYNDIRAIYNTYTQDLDNSWIKSWLILDSLVKNDKEILFVVKSYCKNESKTIPKADSVNLLVRSAILNEYKNMKGLKKLGRYNGLCPYTHYDDIAKESKGFAQKSLNIKNLYLKSKNKTLLFRDYIYLYNDIIYEYNSFVKLAKGEFNEYYHSQPRVKLLKRLLQDGFFKFVAPKKNNTTIEKQNNDKTNIHTSMKGYANNNLVLLLDVSGSMNSKTKLPLLKTSLKLLLKILRKSDNISIVVYSGKAKIVLKSISCSKKEKIEKVIDKLNSSGQTNANKGIKLAYKTANKNLKVNENNRIILATDGNFKIDDKTIELIEQNTTKGIYLSVFDFGNQKSKKLLNLAQTGKGNYEKINETNINSKLVKEAKSISK